MAISRRWKGRVWAFPVVKLPLMADQLQKDYETLFFFAAEICRYKLRFKYDLSYTHTKPRLLYVNVKYNPIKGLSVSVECISSQTQTNAVSQTCYPNIDVLQSPLSRLPIYNSPVTSLPPPTQRDTAACCRICLPEVSCCPCRDGQTRLAGL